MYKTIVSLMVLERGMRASDARFRNWNQFRNDSIFCWNWNRYRNDEYQNRVLHEESYDHYNLSQ